MKRGLILLVSIGTLALVGASLAQVVLVEEPVLNSRKNERSPALDVDGAAADVLAFTRSRTGDPNRHDAWAREGAAAAFKLNAAGQAWTGGIDYPIVSYQQIAGGQSDVFFYDLVTDFRSTPPVNTAKWEWRPSVSGTADDYHLLFGRDNTNNPTQRVVLHHHSDLGAHDSTLLAEVTRASHYLQPDQLNGDFATFTKCTPNCNVYRRDVLAETTTRLAKPVSNRPRQQYAGAVTPGGVVFLVRSGPRCGEKVKIIRYDIDNPSDPTYGSLQVALPSGFDIVTAFARDNGDGSVTLVYDRVNCGTGRFDVYKLEVPAP
jgi:hypothetical protein